MSTTTDPDGTIPVATARQWAENWRAHLAAATPDFMTRSFLIPIIDFKNLLQYNPKAEAVRAFIGLEDPDDVLSAKLMLVPVQNGAEVLYLPLDAGNPGDAPSNVYDLTTACPPTCSPVVGDTLDA